MESKIETKHVAGPRSEVFIGTVQLEIEAPPEVAFHCPIEL